MHHDSSLSISSSPNPFSTPLVAALSGPHFFPIPLLTLFALTHLDSTSCLWFLVFSLFPPHLSPSGSFHCAHTIHPIPTHHMPRYFISPTTLFFSFPASKYPNPCIHTPPLLIFCFLSHSLPSHERRFIRPCPPQPFSCIPASST